MPNLHDQAIHSPPNLTAERQSELLAALEQLAAERSQTEQTLARNRVARQNAANESFHSLRDAEVRRNGDVTNCLEKELSHSISEVKHIHSGSLEELEIDEARFERTAPCERERRLEALRQKAHAARLQSERELQRLTSELKQQWMAFESRWTAVQIQHEAADAALEAEAKRRRVPRPEGEKDLATLDNDHATLDTSLEAVRKANEILGDLRTFQSAKFFDEGWSVLLFIFSALAAIYPAGRFLGWSQWPWVASATIVAASVIVVVVRGVCSWSVKRHARELLPQSAHLLAASLHTVNQAWGRATEEAESKRVAFKSGHLNRVVDIDAKLKQQLQSQAAAYDAVTSETMDAFAGRRGAIQDSMRAKISEIEARLKPQQQQEAAQHQATMEQLKNNNREQVQRAQKAYDDGMEQLVDRWTAGLASFQAEVKEMNAYCGEHFPAWEHIDWEQWLPPTAPATAFPFGHYTLSVNDYGEAPQDKRLQIDEPRFELPAALAFPQRPSLLIEASDEGKLAAVDVMQTLMLRMLMAIPPGKVRFTIVDAETLGQNFSAFMHLADFDEQIVGPRIWTEPQHIQQQLADLTEHTENVIQKYLRNEFSSIQEYNARAGEVAEPYRILVVANFPEGFTDEAAKRLISIANTGSRCGVFTLISIDTRKKFPRDFYVDDLETHATSLQWTHHGFRPKNQRLRALPLTLDRPPNEKAFIQALRKIGKHVEAADNVEVPFHVVAPTDDAIWKSDCSEELDVALGRAGATKLQHLRLGRGVSQHVLISGKTGSGKSTLMHALITNVALHYSPHQVEFYLIDFKKGVEFKPYAAHQLPHARVIAIESEREFGMSVLERLDEELRLRGDLFREQGVQDLAGFRQALPERPMPRVLLIIDEFQELFVKDDKIASESALLLDRLVRQGRAFGMHVLLGSQTLAGGYSLPRSTIGQMAVRIALQCGEADAHLILSEDNTAARLLTRPGEAIYNNANGRFEGNNPFQVVFLSDSERADALERIRNKAESEPQLSATTPIVFEGNIPADPLRTPELLAQLRSPTAPSRTPRAWLGSAVAIKPPTYTDFPAQAGANLLVVGPQEDMALGVMATAAVSLATSSQRPNVYVLDGSRADSPFGHVWQKLAEACPDLQVRTPKDTLDIIQQLRDEMTRRESEKAESAPPQFVVLHNLARFRDVRRQEDAYSFSFSDDNDAAADPAKMLHELLRDGPAWGIHLLVWADSFNTASRWFDRQSLRDFEQRVLFQMTPADSSNLMDSPAASQLGVHRAILYTEEQGGQEKFRPFATPDDNWLRWLADLDSPRASDQK